MKIKKRMCLLLAIVIAGVMSALPAQAKTVVKDMLPVKEWSGEGSLIPKKTAEGWQMRSLPTQDGGFAVSYFDMTYHKGQMIAYDFTVVGDEDADITINIGFIRDLEESVYPNGNKEFIFSQHLAKALGIEASGEMEATIPGGTYKGVLDPGDFFYDGFNQFQHVAFYVGGEEVIIREFAFVDGVEPGAETYPTSKATITTTTTTTTAAPVSSEAPESTPAADAPDDNKTDPAAAGSSPATSSAPTEGNGQTDYTTMIVIGGAVIAVLLIAVIVMAVLLAKKKKE